MSTVRDKIDKCFNPDGSGAETQFNPTWRETVWIIGADDSGTSRDFNLTTFKLTGEEIACSCLAMLEKIIAQSGPRVPETGLLKPRLLRRHTTGKYDGHKS